MKANLSSCSREDNHENCIIFSLILRCEKNTDEGVILRCQTMADHLQPYEQKNERDLEEKYDKLQQIDSRLKNIKNLVMQEALLEGSDEKKDPEEVNVLSLFTHQRNTLSRE